MQWALLDIGIVKIAVSDSEDKMIDTSKIKPERFAKPALSWTATYTNSMTLRQSIDSRVELLYYL